MPPCPKPCSSCPWRRTSRAGAIAGPEGPGLMPGEGDTWEGMVAQAHGIFWLPCHSNMDTGRGKDQDPAKVVPCIGAGIYRTHINHPPHMASPRTPHYPADRATIFADPVEFLMHHMHLSRAEALAKLREVPMPLRIRAEMQRTNTKLYLIPK